MYTDNDSLSTFLCENIKKTLHYFENSFSGTTFELDDSSDLLDLLYNECVIFT